MPTIWFDIDNTPHVHILAPLVEVFSEKNYRIVVTAKPTKSIRELLQIRSLNATLIGSGEIYVGKARKVKGTISRSLELRRFAARQHIDLAVSHGSRSLILAAFLSRIPIVTMDDYEYSSIGLQNLLSTKILMPGFVDRSQIGKGRKFRYYSGFKEEIYLPQFSPDNSKQLLWLGDDRNSVIVTLRPPAISAHYYDRRSEHIFEALYAYLNSASNVKVVFVPRDSQQKAELLKSFLFGEKSIVLPEMTNGLNLIWNSDVVISGGGTMNRESALLGIPTFSIFGGKIGGVDRELERRGRLKIIQTAEDVKTISLTKRPRVEFQHYESTVLDSIVEEIEGTLRRC
jgi:predicted glycosyltransferase